MTTSAHGADARTARLEQVLNLSRSKMAQSQRAMLEAFVTRYFGQVDPEDLAEREPADLYGAALSQWNFAHRREPGQVRVRAFNPRPGAFLPGDGGALKVHRAHAEIGDAAPGSRTAYLGQPAVGTGKGLLVLDEVQPPGKKAMSGRAFLAGARDWQTGG